MTADEDVTRAKGGGVSRSMVRHALLVSLALIAFGAPVARALPPGPPPKRGGGPPPAWLEKPGTDRWLAYSSYCWTTGGTGLCADFIAPQMRTDLPRIRLARGTTVRFHLGFRPTSLQLWRIGGRSWRLSSTRIAAWQAGGPGVYLLQAAVVGGDASYAFRIV
jgi:hypothetical protein